jgi:glycosyltransferase involved in cell wall biosynthesis
MPPLVSMIIPVKNAAPWLGATIESCLAQSWRHVEVIVVDNGSRDDSVEIARRYACSKLTILACERPGTSAARNTGLEKAHGDFVQFLDADDILDRDKIRLQIERLTSGPPASLASCAWARFGSDPREATFLAEPVWRDLAPEEFLIASWLGGGMMPSFSWLVSRATIERAGSWDESLSLNDDGEFFCRVVLASSGVLFCANARGYYRTTAYPTMSKRRDRSALVSAFRATELCCDRLLQRCETDRARKACATQYQRFIYDTYPDAADLVAAAEQHVQQLGGTDLRMQGGRAFRRLSGCVGWKAAKRCQVAWRKLRDAAPSGSVNSPNTSLAATDHSASG